MAHTIVYSQHFKRSKPHPIATIETTDPDHDDVIASLKMDEFTKAKAAGRERPVITTELVDHAPKPVEPLNTKEKEPLKKHV